MATPNDAPDSTGITGQQKTWGTGDFNVLAKSFIGAAEALVEAADPRPGQRVLDVACGSGNAALIAARRYCEVVGLDYVPALLEHARRRAAADGVEIDFIAGDAQALPFADASFDVVLSTFGVMFAPDQEKAASELLRVCRPGGTIALACWMPEAFGGDLFGMVARYVPPPAKGKPSTRWGTEAGVRELLGAGAASIDAVRRTFTQHFRSIGHTVDVFQVHFGPTSRAYGMIDAAAREALRRDMAAVFERYDRSTDETVAMACEYLQVIATRR